MNHYFVLRHGESVANIRGMIMSDPNEGKKDEHGLTKNGEHQVADSVRQAKERGVLNGETIIYSSPFSRCKRTAEIARDILEAKTEIVFDDRLRERWFGDWEGAGNDNYQNVWDRDISDPEHNEADVESVAEVLGRVIALIEDLEAAHSENNILLVSHGDILQILQTFFDHQPASAHREVPHIKLAELRKLR
jgi:probable phosphoglycerate mutase